MKAIQIKKKKSSDIGIEGTNVNIVKTVYYKPTARIIHNGEKLRAFSL